MSEGPDSAPSPNAARAPAEPAPAPDRGRFLPLAKIAVFDIAGPLVAYSLLRSAGLSAVGALVLSGILPVLGVVLGMARDRRVDVVGILVLLGIAVGTGLGLASGNARLVLLEGSVPTVVFGAVCLGSLWTRRPLVGKARSNAGEGPGRGGSVLVTQDHPRHRLWPALARVMWPGGRRARWDSLRPMSSTRR